MIGIARRNIQDTGEYLQVNTKQTGFWHLPKIIRPIEYTEAPKILADHPEDKALRTFPTTTDPQILNVYTAVQLLFLPGLALLLFQAENLKDYLNRHDGRIGRYRY